MTPRSKLLFLGYLVLLLLMARNLPHFRLHTDISGWGLIVLWSSAVLLLPWVLPWFLRLLAPTYALWRWLWFLASILTPIFVILDRPSDFAHWLIAMGHIFVMALGTYFLLIDKAVEDHVRKMQS